MTRIYNRSFRAEDASGNPVAGAQVTLWDSKTGGTQVTDGVTDLSGAPIPGGLLVCDTWGYAPDFQDTLDRSAIWAIGSATGAITGVERVLLEPSDTDARVAALESYTQGSGGLNDRLTAVETSRGTASGIATLDASGKLPATQLPDLSAEFVPQPTAAGASGDSLLLDPTYPGGVKWGHLGGARQALWSDVANKGSLVWVAHRGGSMILPENTVEAYRGAFAAGGVDAVELDVYKTLDGALMVMHDTTVDRTTTGTGANTGKSVMSAARLRVDAGAWFCGNWPSDLRVPTFEDVLEECGGKLPMIVHCNNAGSGALAVAALQRFGLQTSVLIMAWNETELAAARTAGLPNLLLDPDGVLAVDADHPSATYAALLAAGTQYLGVDYAQATDATITAVKNAGLRVVAYTVNRRRDVSRLTGLGVWGIISDDPWYVGSLKPTLTTAPFTAQTYYYGHLSGDVYDGLNDSAQASQMANRGYYVSPDYFGVDSTAASGPSGAGYHGVLLGSICPVANPSGFTLNANLMYDAFSYASAWAAFFVGTDDGPYDDDTDPTGEPNGYHVLYRQDGNVDVYKVTHSGGVATSTKLAGLATPTTAFGSGAAKAVRLQVTSTQLIATRVDTGAAVTVTDNAFRGSYLSFGTRDAKARINSLAIT